MAGRKHRAMKPAVASALGLSLSLLLLLAHPADAPADQAILVAGSGTRTNVEPPLTPTQATLISPFGVDFDPAGQLWLVEMTGHRVRRMTPDGLLAVVAGDGRPGPGRDPGPAHASQFNGIHNLAIAPNGDVYLADT